MRVEDEIRDLEFETALLRAATSAPSADDVPPAGLRLGFVVGFVLAFARAMWDLWHTPIGMGGG